MDSGYFSWTIDGETSWRFSLAAGAITVLVRARKIQNLVSQMKNWVKFYFHQRVHSKVNFWKRKSQKWSAAASPTSVIERKQWVNSRDFRIVSKLNLFLERIFKCLIPFLSFPHSLALATTLKISNFLTIDRELELVKKKIKLRYVRFLVDFWWLIGKWVVS